ncbi:MAG: NHLP family bacteriocin export ABC transporter peptidase/permease/ATPase subunit [Lachnospiraceae bacterium]|nr:NHLP family bacteriocin export ABC transporter peptidase/permease/ATPase subunit [Lachnospiraceae bacterium]
MKREKTIEKRSVAKVPVVIQLEGLECGAASLCMILAYYGKWLPLEQIRSDCGISRDGTKASVILKAARSYGLEAKGYRYSVEALQTEATFPCVIHWEFNHFVVLDGFKKGKAVINDPASGKVEVPLESFGKSYTGICLQFQPGANFKADGKRKSVRGFVRERLKGTAPAIAIVLLTTIITSLIRVINPAMSRIFLDRLLTGENPEWIRMFLAAVVVFALVQFLAAWLQTVSMLRINGKFDAVGSSRFMWKILRLPMNFFSQRLVGDLMMRQAENGTIATSLITTLAPLLLNTVMMVFYLVVMLRYSVLLSLIGITAIVVNMLVAGAISRKRVDITKVQMRDQGKLGAATVSGIEMIETIKASGAENGYFQRWSGYQARCQMQLEKFERTNSYMGVIPDLISGLADTAVLILGIYLVMQGAFTAGMVMAFQGYLSAFTGPASDIIKARQTIQEMRTSMERIEDVMNYPDDVVFDSEKRDEPENYRKLTGNIEIKKVSFGYTKIMPPLIEDFSLKLEPGKSVALVGSSGSGKSTIAKLLSGLYQPWSGEILFDGKRITEINREVFTGSLAVVDQDITLFEDTIAANIKMWDASIEDFEMILAARDAQIHEDIMKREGGYQYKIMENGKDFSGGQRQRLEIARVLAQDPTIIVMDEATSALDAKTEHNVVQAIKDRGITCVVIAHRLSTIRDCDEILVLDHGKVAERGTHEELYAKGGIYTSLVSNE